MLRTPATDVPKDFVFKRELLTTLGANRLQPIFVEREGTYQRIGPGAFADIPNSSSRDLFKIIARGCRFTGKSKFAGRFGSIQQNFAVTHQDEMLFGTSFQNQGCRFIRVEKFADGESSHCMGMVVGETPAVATRVHARAIL